MNAGLTAEVVHLGAAAERERSRSIVNANWDRKVRKRVLVPYARRYAPEERVKLPIDNA